MVGLSLAALAQEPAPPMSPSMANGAVAGSGSAGPAPGGAVHGTAVSSGGGAAQALGIVVAVVMLAGAGFILLYRGSSVWRPGAKGPKKLLVEETRALGQRQFLAVVEYEGRKMLLGVCPGRIDYLCPLDGEDEPSPDFQRLVPPVTGESETAGGREGA